MLLNLFLALVNISARTIWQPAILVYGSISGNARAADKIFSQVDGSVKWACDDGINSALSSIHIQTTASDLKKKKPKTIIELC